MTLYFFQQVIKESGFSILGDSFNQLFHLDIKKAKGSRSTLGLRKLGSIKDKVSNKANQPSRIWTSPLKSTDTFDQIVLAGNYYEELSTKRIIKNLLMIRTEGKGYKNRRSKIIYSKGEVFETCQFQDNGDCTVLYLSNSTSEKQELRELCNCYFKSVDIIS